MQRRDFLKTTAAGGLTLTQLEQSTQAKDVPKRTFRVWAMGCSHVGTDIRKERESLAEAIRHSEWGGDDGGPAFDWDIALHLGDLAGAQGGPDDEEGREVVRQFAAAKKHRREHFYNLAGNHDASGPGEPSNGMPRSRARDFGAAQAASVSMMTPSSNGSERRHRRRPVRPGCGCVLVACKHIF